MGAKRNINVTGANKNTQACTTGGTFTHAQLFEADGVTPVSNPFLLDNAQTIATGSMLNVADAGVSIKLGVAGSAVVGQLADAVLIRMLNAENLDGTEVLKFGTGVSGNALVNPGYIPALTSDAWDTAVAF